MNKIFKVIWSKSKQCYIVVSEIAKNKTGKKKIVVAGIFAALAMVNGGDSTVAAALPGGVTGQNAMWIGNGATVNGTIVGQNSIAIGRNANSKSAKSIAIGSDSVAEGVYKSSTDYTGATAIGAHTNAKGAGATALGVATSVNGDYSIGLGWNTNVSADNSIAIGVQSRSTKEGSTAMGPSARGYGEGSLSLGYQALAGADVYGSGINVINNPINDNGGIINSYAKWGDAAIGLRAVATGGNATALGRSARAAAANAIAIGGGNGNSATDNTEKTEATGEKATAIGYNAKAGAEKSTAIGAGATANGLDSFAGASGTASGAASVAIGKVSKATDSSATAVGDGTSALGQGATALGSNATAKNGFDLAVGRSVTSEGGAATVVGYNSNVKGNQSIGIGSTIANSAQKATAIGYKVTVSGSGAIGIGSGTDGGSNVIASGSDAIALGTSTLADSEKAIAIGANSKGTNIGATALGRSSEATGASATALGSLASATGSTATAVGMEASATGNESLAIGKKASATSGRALAVGTNTTATGASSVAVGSGAGGSGIIGFAGSLNSTAGVVNTNRTINYATTAEGDTAVAVGYYANAKNSGVAVGQKALAATGGVAIGKGVLEDTGNNYAGGVVIGQDSASTGVYSLAMGFNAFASGSTSMAIGHTVSADGGFAVAMGRKVSASGTSTAIGHHATATNGGLAIGSQDNDTSNDRTTASATGAVAIGKNAKATSEDAVAIGTNAQATLQGAVALGSGSTTATGATSQGSTTINGITYNFAGATGNPNMQVSVGSAGATRQIKNVAAGEVSATSTDAINGSQLYAVARAVKPLKYVSVNSTAAGTGSNVDNDGAQASDSIAIGPSSSVTRQNGIAIGNGAKSLSEESIVIGRNAQAETKTGAGLTTTSRAIAIGSNSRVAANVTQGIAIGSGLSPDEGAVVTGDQSIAIGGNVKVDGHAAIAIGGDDAKNASNQQVSYTNTNDTEVTGTLRNAILDLTGYDLSKYKGTTAGHAGVAYGTSALAGNAGVAIGTAADSMTRMNDKGQVVNDKPVTNAVAIGTGARANFDNSVAIGGGSNTDHYATKQVNAVIDGVEVKWSGGENIAPGDVVSFGAKGFERQLKNVAPGEVSQTSTDAVNGSQIYSLARKVTNIMNGGSGSVVNVNSLGQPLSKVVTTENGNKVEKYYRTSDIREDGTVPTGTSEQTPTSLALVNVSEPNANLRTTKPRILGNVANGVNDNDAVNVSQLKAATVKYFSVNSTIGGNRNNDKATGINAIAVGPDAEAAGKNTISVGNAAGYQTTGENNVGIGTSAGRKLSGDNNISIGSSSGNNSVNNDPNKRTTYTNNSVMLGNEAKVIDSSAQNSIDNVVVIGNRATSSGSSSVVLGTSASGTDKNVIAIGNSSKATSISAVALGNTANATGLNAMALGLNTNASNENSVAIGNTANASAKNTLAMGTNTKASSEAAIALGANAESSGFGSIAIGEKSKAQPTTATSPAGSVAIGYRTESTGDFAVALGSGNGSYKGASANGVGTVAVGTATVTASGRNFQTVVGFGATTNNVDAAAFGHEAKAYAEKSLALGTGSSATVIGGVALGSGSVANTDKNKQGFDQKTGRTDTYAGLKNEAFTSTAGAVSVGDVANKVTRQITGVAAGTNDTDAVNVAQLKSVNLAFTGNTGNGGDVNLSQSKLALNGDNQYITTKADGKSLTISGKKQEITVSNGVASANSGMADASNVAQAITQAVSDVKYNWKLSANGQNSTETIDKGDTVDFSGDNNITVSRSGKKITTKLNDTITVDSVNAKKKVTVGTGANQIALDGTLGVATVGAAGSNQIIMNGSLGTIQGNKFIGNSFKAGRSSIDNDGLTITNGPSVLATGINAGNKQITGVSSGGTIDTNAANIGDVKKAVANVSQNLNISDGTKDSSVALKSQKLTVTGTGAATTAVNNQTITVDVAEGMLSNNADGTVKADAAGVATTKNVADVINKTISDNQYSWKLSANGEATTATVGKGDTVDFTGDTNITVDRNNKDISVKLNKNLIDMNSISLGNARGETIFLNGRDGSIKAGKAEFKDNVGAGSTITSDQLSFTNGATGANESTTTIALDTVAIQSGPNSSALTSKYLTFSDEDGNNAEGSAKGVVFQNAAGKLVQFTVDEITAGGNKIKEVAEGTADTDAVNVKQLKDTIGGQSLTYRANTSADTDAKSVKLSKGLDFVNGTSTVASVDEDGKVSFDLNTATKNQINTNTTDITTNTANIAHTIALADDAGASTTAKSLKDGNVSFNIKGDNKYISTAASGNDVTLTVNEQAIKDAAKNASSFKVKANATAAEDVKGGDTIAFNNGDNIEISQTGKTFTIKTAKNITVDSVTAGNTVINTSGLTNGTTAITGTGVTTDKVTVGGLSIDKTAGINAGGKVISNVASGGTTDSNAANIGDVKQAVANLSQNLNITDGTNNGTVDLKNQKLNVAGANGVTATVNNQKITVGLDANTVNATTKGIGLTADTGSTGNKYLKDGDVSFAVTGDGNLVSTSATAAGVKVAVDAAKVKDLAVSAVTVSKDTQADNPITVTPTAGTNSKDYAIGIDTTKLAAKTDLTYRANSAADANAKKISLSKGLNFVDGGSTVATVDNDGKVSFDLNTATKTQINTNTTDIATNKGNIATNTADIAANKGKIATNTTNIAANTTALARNISLGADTGTASSQSLSTADVAFNVKGATGDFVSTNMNGNTVEISTKRATINSNATTGEASVTGNDGLATAQNVADAINKAADAAKAGAAWNITTNSSTTDKTAVKGGDTVDLVNGDNIEITQDGTDKKKITVATKKDITVDSVTANNKVTVGSGANKITLDGTDGSVTGKAFTGTTFTGTSFTGTSFTAGNTVINTNGLTNGTTAITGTGVTTDNVTVGGISIDKTAGINAGNKVISNVASGGTTATNAANIGDVQTAVANLSQNLNITDGTHDGTVDLKNQKLNVAGANGVTATVNNQTITVGLDADTVNATTKGIGLTADTGSTGNKYLKDGDVSFAVTGDGSLVSTSATAAGVKVAVNSATITAGTDGTITGPTTDGVATAKNVADAINVAKKASKTEITANTGEAANATTGNVTLTSTTAADGHTIYDVKLNDKVTLGSGANAVTIDGTSGAITGKTATIGGVTVNGTANTIGGLSNTTWNGTAVSGRAATEDQLKAATSATTLKFTGDVATNTGSVNLKDDTFGIKGDGKYISTDVNGKNVNLTVSEAEVKKSAVAAVTVSTDTTDTNNPLTVTPTTSADGTTKDYKVTIDGTKIANKTNLSYKANNGTAKQVSLADGLDFTNGTLTTASIDNKGVVKYDVNTASITAGADGTITGPTTDGVATAKNVADAINAAKKASKTEITANTGEAANATTGNVTLTSTTAADGHTIYDVKLNDKVTLGSGANAVTIDGTVGKATIGSSVVDGVNNTFTTGGANAVKLDGVAGTIKTGTVTVTGGTTNDITGLSNTTVTAADFATKGRAATEEQLKAVGEQTWQITADKDATTSGAQTGTKENAKVGKDDKVSLIAGENLTVDQVGKNFTYSLNTDLVKMNSATFEATGGKTTVIKGDSIVQTDGANVNTSNATSNTITDGTNTSTITAGKAQIGTVGIDGVVSKISTGGTNAVVVNGADGTIKTGNVTVTGGTTNDITGLSNTTLTATDFATKGRAATEEQLKAATGATTLKFTGDVATNTGSVNLKDDTFGIKGDGKYISTDVNGKNVNLTVSEAEVKKSAVAAVTVSTDTTDANNPLTVTPTTSADGTTKDYKVTIDGTKIANKTNLSYKANDGTAKQVSLADGLNFKNGTLTTASIDDNGVVKYDVNTASITAGADGTITGPTTDGVATAKNVADAINAAKKASKTEVTANTGEAANATIGNVTLTSTTAADGHTIYDVKLNDKVTLGSGANTVTVDGTAAKVTAGVTTVDGATGTITTGGTNSIKVDGATGTVTGLTNKDWTPGVTKAVTGRAATEDQLQKVADAASSQTWNITADKAGTTGNQTGTKKNATVGKDETVELVAGDNLTINQDERKFTYSLNKDLAGLTSVSVGTGTTETIKLDGATGKITAKNAVIGGVTIDGDNNHVTGLANTTWNGTATTGRAATEDQLKAVAETAKTTTDAVNLKFSGNTNTSPGVVNLKDDTLGIVGDGKYVSTDANGKNLTVKVSEAEVKKSAVAAVTVSTDTTDANNPLTVTPTTSADGTTKDYKVTIDGTKIANKTNLSYKANDGTAKQVSLADGLNFKNGTLTTASIDDNGVVKYDVNTASITAGADGTITGPTTDGVATAKNVADAINAAKKASKTEITANTGEAANATTGNVTLTSTTAADGHTIYDVKLNDKVTLGSGANAVTIDGTAGKATIGTSIVDGANNTFTTGGASPVTLNGATGTITGTTANIGGVTVNGTANTIGGLSNTTWNGTATTGRAATEDQLKAVADAAGSQTWEITADKKAGTSGAQTGTKENAKVGKDDKVSLIAGENLTVDQVGKNFTYSLNTDLVKMNSATFLGTGTNTTVITGDSITQTAGTQTNTSTAAGNTVANGTKSTETTADGQVIKDGTKINTSTVDENTIVDGARSNKTTVDSNVIDDGNGNVNTSNATSNTITDGTNTSTITAGKATIGSSVIDGVNNTFTTGGANAVKLDGAAGIIKTGTVTVTGGTTNDITGLSNTTLSATDFATKGRAATEEQLKAATGATTLKFTGDVATNTGSVNLKDDTFGIKGDGKYISTDVNGKNVNLTVSEAEVKKSAVAAVTVSTDTTDANNPLTVTPTTSADGTTKDYKVTIDGTKIANKTNLSYKANGGTAKQVSLADGLNFKNGTLTTASIDDAGVVKYDVNTASITAGADGTITGPTTDGVATAKNVADAINAAKKASKTEITANTGEAANATTGNVTLTSTTAADGHTIYDVKLNDKVTLGSGANAVTIDGTAGKATIGSSIVDGVNNTFTTGGASPVTLNGATGTITGKTANIGGVTVDGTNNHVMGLANKDWTPGVTQAVSGRAATEDQLQKVSDAVGAGWKVNTGKVTGSTGESNGAASTKVASGEEVQFQAGNNLVVDQNGKTVAYSLNKALKDLESATFNGTGTNKTVINGDSITQTAGTQTNTSTAGGNTVADGTKSTETTVDGQVIKDGAKSNKSTVDSNVIDDGNGKVNTSNATSNTITDGTNTTATTSSSVTVKDNAGNSTVITKDNITTGVGGNKITLDGTAGKATVGASVIDGVNNTFTTGGANAVKLDGTAGTIKTGTVTVTGGTTNDITGLSNTTVTAADFATKGRAATEEQLKAVGEQTWQITADKDATTSGAQTGTKKDAKVGKDDKVQLIAGENMTVNQNERDFTFTLNKDLVKMNSATFLGTGTNTTVITGDSITQTAGTQTNTSTAAGNTVADSTKSTETTAAGQVIKDGAKSNKSTVSSNVIDDGTGNVNTSNATSNTITDGTNTSTITAGKATIGSSIVDGVNNTFTTGGANAVKLDGVAGTIKTGTVTVTGGTTNDITGLSNTTVTAADFATKGRAATEEQLKAVGEQTWKITADKDTATSGDQTGTKKDAKVGKDDKVQLIAGENMTVNQNERDFTFTLNKNLVKINSATFLGTGTNKTVITGDFITQTAGTQTNTSTAAGNTVADGTKSTETTAAGQVIKDGAKTNTSTVDENTLVDGAKSNKTTVDSNVIDDGTNTSTITAGKATIGSSIIDGVNNTFITGGASPVTLNGATGTITGKTANIGGVTVDGTNNHVMGLANKDWTPGVTQAVSGRAATEDQLQKVSDAVGAGWKVNTGKVTGSTGESNGAASTKVASSEEVQFQAGNNLIVDQNGKTVAYSLNKALKDLESATFNGTGTNKTVITGDSITQTAGTQTNTSTAGGNTVADGTKSTETTAAGQVIKDGTKTNTSTVDENTIVDGTKSNKSTVDGNTITDGTNTTVTTSSSVTVKDNAGNSTVITKDNITTGVGGNKIILDGTAGKATIGSSIVDGVNNTFTTGGANAVKLDGVAGTIKTGTVTVTGGTTNDITGLSNTTVTGADFATKGRAATEEQLKAVGEQTWQITADKDATTSGAQTGTKKDAKVGKDDKVQLIAGENMTVNQNERDFTFTLNKDLVKMNSATFEATGGKTTVIKGDSIVQTDGTKVNTFTAGGNTVVDGTKSTVTTADGTTVTSANGNTNYAADGVRINTTGKNPVSLTDAGLDNGNNVIKNVASGHVNNDATDNTNAANIADVKKATTTVTANAGEAANATTGNVTLTSTTAADGHTIYDVKLNNKVTLGSGANAVTIDGTAGKATIGSSVVDGVNNIFTTGGANAIKLDGVAGTIKTGTVIVTGGTTNDITGLSNTTVTAADFATKGRAATEEQLKAVGEQTWQITADKDATTSGAQTGTKKDAKVGKDDKVQLIAGENMTVNQNERDFTFTLNKDLVKMNSATFLGTGSNTTVITGNSITQTAGTQTNTSTAGGNTVADGTKSTETTADGQVIKDGAKSNKSTVDNNVIDDGNGNVNTSNATSNTITDGTNTTATTSSSVTVKDNAGNSTVITKDNVTTGVGGNKITLDGTAGKATIGSSVVDGVNNTFTTGGTNAVTMNGAAGTIKTGTVTVTGGTTNDITGLSNTTVNSADFATKGRAATEEQLKAVGEQTWQITADKDATTSGAQTGTKKDAKVGKDDKVQLIAGENMTVNQNERDFTFTLNKDLVKMNSATFLGTGSNKTVITGDSITQTAGTQTNTSTAGGNTVADGTKSTETTADGQVIKDGAKSNKSTVDNNVIDDGTGNVNTSNATSNTVTDGTNTTATTSSSVTVKDNTGNSTVITKDNITTGVGANKVTLDGTAGKATIGSSIVDGVNNTFTTGGANAVKLDGVAGTIKTGTVTVTGGTTNDITGLSNTTVTAADFATKGRAATEEQLKAVGEQTWQITADKDATTSGAQTGTKKDAKVGKDNKVQLIAGENMTINQNERDFTFTLNKDLVKMNSATFLGTGSNTTVITGNSITQTAGTQTNTSTAGGNTVADGTKSTETTAAGQVIKDGAKSNKSTVDSNVIDDGNGHVNTSNATSNTITDGTNTSTITAGKANIGNIAVDGVNNKITMGNGATPVTLDGANGHLDGLTNTTWVPGVTKATTGRAATEDQLQQVSDAVGAGWKVNTGTVAGSSGVSNGAASTKVSSGEEVKLQAGDNLVIDQNGKTVSYSLNKDLTKMNSATFEATGGKTTVIKGDSIVQTDGGKTNTSNAAGNTVVDGNKSTATTAAGTTITDGAKTNTSTADKNVINDGAGNTNVSNATSNTLKNAAGDETKSDAKGVTVKDAAGNNATFTKDGITITKTGKDTVSLTSNGLDNGKNKIVNVAAGVANTDAVNVGQLKEYAAKSTTELTANNGETAGSAKGNIVLTKTTAADGHTIYDNKLNDKITLGTDPTKAVTVDGTTGTVTGLTNKTWTPGSIVSGRAATEDQLKDAVADSGWKAAVDKEGSGQSTVVGTSPEKIKAEETVTFKAGNNMMVTQTGKSISYAVNPELTNMTSATFKDAAGNTTVTNGNGITITPGSANPTNPHAGPVSLTKDGLNNGNNQIKGVAPGTDPTDAVNVSQLNASNANTSQAINQIAGEVQHVGAHAAAMAALKPIQYDPLEPTQVMAGVGNYRGETAAALGLAHYTNENTMFNVGVSVGGNHNMVNAGVTHKFGYSPEKKNIPDRYKAGPISSVYVMQDEVSSLKKENAEQKYVIADQAARLTTLEAENEQQRRELAETKKGLDDLKAAVDKLLASKG